MGLSLPISRDMFCSQEKTCQTKHFYNWHSQDAKGWFPQRKRWVFLYMRQAADLLEQQWGMTAC